METPQRSKSETKKSKRVSQVRKVAKKVKSSLSRKGGSKDDVLEVSSRGASEVTQASVSSGSRTKRFLEKPMQAIKKLRRRKSQSQESFGIDISSPSGESQDLLGAVAGEGRKMELGLGAMDVPVSVDSVLEPSVAAGEELSGNVHHNANGDLGNCTTVTEMDLEGQRLEGVIAHTSEEEALYTEGRNLVEVLPSVDEGKDSNQSIENDFLQSNSSEPEAPFDCEPREIIRDIGSAVNTKAIDIEQMALDSHPTGTDDAQTLKELIQAKETKDWMKLVALGGITAGAFLIMKLVLVR